MLHKSFNSAKCKTSLRLAISRIKLLKNKRLATVSQLRREVSKLLEGGQDQTARIRVEHVIREEKTVAAYEFIEVFCELISARLNIIESHKNCPVDLKEAIASVIFASHRCPDVTELSDVRKRLAAKYGKEFVAAALELRPNCGVSSLMVEKLSAKTPDIETKVRVLTAIATEYGINWEPKSFEEQLKKSQDERLDGPSSFGALKMGSESATSDFPVPNSHYSEPAARPPEKDIQCLPAQRRHYNESATKPPENEVQNPVPYSAYSTKSEFHVQSSHSNGPATKLSEKEVQSFPVLSSQYSELETKPREKEGQSFPVLSSQYSEPATKPPEKKIESPATYSASSSASVPIPTEYRAEPRPAEPRDQSAQLENSYPRGMDDSLESDNQNMDFRDASSAARAAAESAKRASIAARAAAEFASQATGSRQTGHGETSQTAHEISSKSKAERVRVEEDFKDAEFNRRGTKEASKSPKFSEHHSSEVMHHDFRSKNKAKEEDSEGLRRSSIRTMTSSPPFSDFDEPDPSFNVAGRSSKRITSKQATNYSHGNSQMMQDDLIGKNRMISEDDEEDEVEEEHHDRSNSSHYHRVEEEYVRSNSSDYDASSDDGDTHKLSFSNNRVGNTIHEKGSRMGSIKTQSGSEEIQSSTFRSISNSLDGDIHSALHNRKNNSHVRDDFVTDDETGDLSDKQQESFSNAAVFDDYGPYDGDYRDVFNTFKDNVVEPDILKSKSSDFSINQDTWFCKDNKCEPPIERHMNSDIFSVNISPPENAKETMEDSSPTYDEALPPKFDDIDEHYNSDSENDADMQEEGNASSNMDVLYRDRERSVDRQNSLDDQIGQGLKLGALSGGLKNKGLVRPPYIRGSPESHLSSKERVDDPPNRAGHGSRLTSEKSWDNKASIVESTSLSFAVEYSSSGRLSRRHAHGKKSYDDNDAEQDIKSSEQYSDFGSSEGPQVRSKPEHSSRDRLSGTDIYSRKSQDNNGMEQDFKSSWQYSDSGSSKEDRQPSSQFEHSSSDRLSEREVFRKKSYDEDDVEQGFQSSRQSDLGSSKEDPQLHSPAASRRTRPGTQSRRTKGFSTISNTESSSISHQLDSDLFNTAYQPDSEIETKPPQSRSDDVKSRWNRKYSSSKPFEDEDADSSQQMDKLSIKETSDLSLHTTDMRKEVKMTYGSAVHTHSYQNIEPKVSSLSASDPTVLADPETPSKSDMRKKWNNKYFRPSEKLLKTSIQSDEFSGDELCASPHTVRPVSQRVPETSDGPSTKPDVRERWRSKYSSPQPSDKHLAPPAKRNELSEKELHGSLSTIQPSSKETIESSDGSPSKSDMKDRWHTKYSSPQPSEKHSAPPVRRNEPSNKEFHVSPYGVQPTTKGTPESLDLSSSKSDLERRLKNNYSSSQPSEKNPVPPVQTNDFSTKDLHASASTGRPSTKRAPLSSDETPFKPDKYVPQPSEKHLVPPVQANKISEKEPRASPATVQPKIKGASESSEGSFKKENLESQSSRQSPKKQSEGSIRATSGSDAAEVQSVRHDLTSAVSSDNKVSPMSPQVSVSSPRTQPHPSMPTDYDAFAARFRALKNRGKK